jgi:hypothetical protein
VQPRADGVVGRCVVEGDEEGGLFGFEERDRVDAALVEDRAQREQCFFEQLVAGAAHRAHEYARDADSLGIVRRRRPECMPTPPRCTSQRIVFSAHVG